MRRAVPRSRGTCDLRHQRGWSHGHSCSFSTLRPDPQSFAAREIVRFARDGSIMPVPRLRHPGVARKERWLDEKDATNIRGPGRWLVLDPCSNIGQALFELTECLAAVALAEALPREPRGQGTPLSEVAEANDSAVWGLELEEERRELGSVEPSTIGRRPEVDLWHWVPRQEFVPAKVRHRDSAEHRPQSQSGGRMTLEASCN